MKLPGWVVRFIEHDLPERFTGNITFNCLKGDVQTIRTDQTIKQADRVDMT